MATYPSGIFAPTNPSSSDKMNVVPHAAQHAAVNAEIVAIETALGVNMANAGGKATELSFTNSDLAAGILTVTHNKALTGGYTAIVTVINNSGAMCIPDQVNTFAANSFKVDLTSYGVLTGTWFCTYVVKS